MNNKVYEWGKSVNQSPFFGRLNAFSVVSLSSRRRSSEGWSARQRPDGVLNRRVEDKGAEKEQGGECQHGGGGVGL